MQLRGHYRKAEVSNCGAAASPMRRGCGRRAYVLPLTLLLLTIAATSLAGVCRVSFERAVQAVAAKEDLQRRWAITSSRRALLPKAERVLTRMDSESDELSEARVAVVLGGLPVELVFGDEQAKVKVDVLYKEGGRAGAEQALRELVLGERGSDVDVRVSLDPVFERLGAGAGGTTSAGEEDDANLFLSWSQVFGDTPPGPLVARRSGTPSAVAEVTCWGDGTLNFRRASVEALRRACPDSLSATDVAKLVRLRREDPELELYDALEQLELNEDQLAQVEERLTDESSCYSLWIIVGSGRRAWYDLSVADSLQGGDEQATPLTFSW